MIRKGKTAMKYKKTCAFIIALIAVIVLTEAVFKPVFFAKTASVETKTGDLQDDFSSILPNSSIHTPIDSTVENTKAIPEGYEKQLSDNTNELYFLKEDGGIALLNKQSGDIWFSNPIDETNPDAKSQFKVYYSDTLGVAKSMDSFTYSVSRGDITLKNEKNTFSVEYLLSEDSISTNDVPNIISAERFNSFADELSSSEKAVLTSNYVFLSIQESSDEKYNKEIISQYPTVKNYDIYVLNTSNKRQLQKILLSFKKAGYTAEDLKKDFEDNGLEATSQSVSFTVVLDYKLENGSLYLDIDSEKLRYPKNTPIEKIELMRFFGAANKNDSGYFLLPDGSGTLICFNNGKTNESVFSLPVYGVDSCFTVDEQKNVTQKSAFPIIGIRKNNSALIVTMEKGESLADIKAEVSGMSSEYNISFFTLNLVRSQQESVTIKSVNTLKEKTPYSGKYTLRYTPIPDKNADYIKMAQSYRKQLIEIGRLDAEKHKDEYPILISLLGAVTKTKSFLGIKYNSAIALTSFEEAEQIARELSKNGVYGLNLQYYGWTNGGLRQSSPDKITVNKALGGNKGMSKLQSYMADNNIPMFFNTSFSNISDGSGFNIKKEAVKKLSGASARIYPFNYVNGYKNTSVNPLYILSPNVLADKTNGFIKKAEGLNIKEASSDDLASVIASDFNTASTVNRVDSQDISAGALDSLNGKLSMALGNPNAYAFKNANLAYDVPTTDSAFKITDGSVPFYQAVIRGYVNFASTPINYSPNNRYAFLRAVEYGSGLSYFVNYHSTNELKNTEYNIYNRGTYGDWSKIISEDAKSAKAVFDKLNGKEIVGHSYIANGVYKTEYEGGMFTVVNYSDTDYLYGKITVPAENFIFNGGEAD